MIGTRSVDKSEKLSQRLHKVCVEHQVLNARPEDRRAILEIVRETKPNVPPSWTAPGAK